MRTFDAVWIRKPGGLAARFIPCAIIGLISLLLLAGTMAQATEAPLSIQHQGGQRLHGSAPVGSGWVTMPSLQVLANGGVLVAEGTGSSGATVNRLALLDRSGRTAWTRSVGSSMGPIGNAYRVVGNRTLVLQGQHLRSFGVEGVQEWVTSIPLETTPLSFVALSEGRVALSTGRRIIVIDAAGRLLWQRDWPLLRSRVVKAGNDLLLIAGASPEDSRLHRLDQLSGALRWSRAVEDSATLPDVDDRSGVAESAFYAGGNRIHRLDGDGNLLASWTMIIEGQQFIHTLAAFMVLDGDRTVVMQRDSTTSTIMGYRADGERTFLRRLSVRNGGPMAYTIAGGAEARLIFAERQLQAATGMVDLYLQILGPDNSLQELTYRFPQSMLGQIHMAAHADDLYYVEHTSLSAGNQFIHVNLASRQVSLHPSPNQAQASIPARGDTLVPVPGSPEFVIAGVTRPSFDTGRGQLFASRLDRDGRTRWTTSLPSESSLDAALMLALPDGVLLIGSAPVIPFSAPNCRGLEVRRLDYDGSVRWSRTIPATTGIAAAAAGPDGSLILAGDNACATPYGMVARTAFRAGLSATGTLLFNLAQPRPISGYSRFNDLAALADGTLVAVGTVHEFNSDYDCIAQRFNAAGEVLWTRIFAGSGADSECQQVRQSAAGRLYVTGTEKMGAAQSATVRELSVNDGQILREWSAAGMASAFPVAFDIHPNGTLVLASGIGGTNHVLALDPQLQTRWQRSLATGTIRSAPGLVIAGDEIVTGLVSGPLTAAAPRSWTLDPAGNLSRSRSEYPEALGAAPHFHLQPSSHGVLAIHTDDPAAAVGTRIRINDLSDYFFHDGFE